MPRILAIDYGKKRTGIAVTDPLKIIAAALETVETSSLVWWLKQYVAKEQVEKVIIGYPLNLDGTATDATAAVEKFINNFKQVFPTIPIETIDERMSSKMASQQIAQMGLKKKDREKKELIDAVAAAMMLQDYLERQS
jgi:putative Holliday junction resolvase